MGPTWVNEWMSTDKVREFKQSKSRSRSQSPKKSESPNKRQRPDKRQWPGIDSDAEDGSEVVITKKRRRACKLVTDDGTFSSSRCNMACIHTD